MQFLQIRFFLKQFFLFLKAVAKQQKLKHTEINKQNICLKGNQNFNLFCQQAIFEICCGFGFYLIILQQELQIKHILIDIFTKLHVCNFFIFCEVYIHLQKINTRNKLSQNFQ
eukprot:TRINITY_DN8022_c0_g3_i1.p12 TRINITY_DN8022_c0_g3~~TRINITY_DN8022_c0_g3_i1.p12  ORF type:complete len:113 (+),score=8.30 TRINITY_DN8022_c0_g3_i1:1226-1564(+)